VNHYRRLPEDPNPRLVRITQEGSWQCDYCDYCHENACTPDLSKVDVFTVVKGDDTYPCQELEEQTRAYLETQVRVPLGDVEDEGRMSTAESDHGPTLILSKTHTTGNVLNLVDSSLEGMWAVFKVFLSAQPDFTFTISKDVLRAFPFKDVIIISEETEHAITFQLQQNSQTVM